MHTAQTFEDVDETTLSNPRVGTKLAGEVPVVDALQSAQTTSCAIAQLEAWYLEWASLLLQAHEQHPTPLSSCAKSFLSEIERARLRLERYWPG